MPNFSYTASKSWTPYTFEELLKPLAMYTEEYNRQEEALSELGAKADLLRKQAQEAGGDVANVYNTYADELDKQADLLARQGLTPSSRTTLRNLHRQYAKDISPIEEAIKYKKSMAEEQRKLRAQDSSIMFDRDYSTINLNEIYNNPQLGYTPVSGDELYKQGAAAAKAASSRNINIEKALGTQYYAIKQGYGDEAAQQFLLNNESIPELHDAIGRIIAQSGVTNENKARAVDYIINGMMSGLVYDEKYQANRGFMTDEQREEHEWRRGEAEAQRELREEQVKGIKLPNGDRIKPMGGGKVMIIHSDGTYSLQNTPKATESEEYTAKSTDKSGIPLQPVIVDKASYGSGFGTAGYVGEDWTGIANWVDFTRKTRDWGADYQLPDKEDIISIDLKDVDIKALEKIKNRVNKDNKGSFNANNYNYYIPKNNKNRAGVIAVPQNNDPYQSTVVGKEEQDNTVSKF